MMHIEWQRLSIVDWETKAAVASAAFAVLAASWLVPRRWFLRWGVRALTLPFIVLFVAVSINAHYGYFPTLGTLFGRNAADQISAADFARLKEHYRQPRMHRIGRHIVVVQATPDLPRHGVVISFQIPTPLSGFPARKAQVYLPPVWFQAPHPHLPVIELLHGSPGSPADWTRAGGADVTADNYASHHGGYAPILVMPDVNGSWSGDTECVNGPRGNAETYLTLDVRNAIVREFAARADGGSWAIAGLSEGGSCALQMGLRHPSLFKVIGDFSGDDHPWVLHNGQLFWGATPAQQAAAETAYDPRALLSNWHSKIAPVIAFVVGNDDPLRFKMMRLEQQALADRIDAHVFILHGGHTFWLWQRSLQGALPWMMPRLATATRVSARP